jgi:hypothetical protein
MTIQCAWCKLIMRLGTTGEISHGICPPCSEKFETGAVPKKEAA